MKLRKIKHLIPKGRYCYQWVNYKTREVKLCPFWKPVDNNSLEDYCTLVKTEIFDQIKSCNIKLNY